MPLADAQAAFAAAGQWLAIDPPLGAATRHHRRPDRHRRLRPAAPPLRRDARPRHRHHRRALRRHGRHVRRQGHQERRRLRPRQAVHRVVRHARPDRADRGAAAPRPAGTATVVAPHRRPGRAGARRQSSWPPATAGGRRASTLGGGASAAAGPLRRRPRPPSAPRTARAHVAIGRRRSWPTTTSCGRGSERAQRAPDGVVVKVSGRPTDLPAWSPRRPPAGGTWSRAPALGLSWLAAAAPAPTSAALRAALAPRAVHGAGRRRPASTTRGRPSSPARWR